MKISQPTSVGDRVLRSHTKRVPDGEKSTVQEKILPKTSKVENRVKTAKPPTKQEPAGKKATAREQNPPKTRRSTGVKKAKPIPKQPPTQPLQPLAVHIDSLPEEILGRIFLLLPWRDRVLHLERVSKKWCAVVQRHNHFNNTELENEEKDEYAVQKWDELLYASTLQRVGPLARKLSLGSEYDAVNLRPYLQPCQQLQHLSLESVGLTAGRIKSIREEMGGRLQSLRLDDCTLTSDTSTITALNQLLSSSPHLTCLHLREPFGRYSQSFAAQMLARIKLPLRLHCLGLHGHAASVLNHPSTVSSLCSLQIEAGRLGVIHSSWPLEQLTTLSVALPEDPKPGKSDCEDFFFTVLERTKQLRTLELWRVPASVIRRLPNHPSVAHLEHLTLLMHCRRQGEPAGPALTSIGPWLRELRSLSVQHYSISAADTKDALNWLRTLTDTSKLEYLDLGYPDLGREIPMHVLTEVLLRCKKLRALRFRAEYCNRPEDYLRLIAPLADQQDRTATLYISIFHSEYLTELRAVAKKQMRRVKFVDNESVESGFQFSHSHHYAEFPSGVVPMWALE